MCRYTGALTDENIIASSDAMLNDPRWKQCTYYIADARGAEFGGLSMGVLRQLAERHRQLADETPQMRGVAIMESRLARGLANVYLNWHRGMGESWSLEAVATEAEARALLGLPPAKGDASPPLESG